MGTEICLRAVKGKRVRSRKLKPKVKNITLLFRKS